MRLCKSTVCLLAVLLFCWAAPATARGPERVDFEDLRAGQEFGVGDRFVDSGVKISVEQVVGPHGTPWAFSGRAIVGSDGRAGGSGNELFMDPINLRFSFGYVPQGLTIRFSEWGVGNINLEINRDLRFDQHFTDLHGQTIGGVKVSVLGGAKDQQGILELSGAIESFMIGGFELFLDDITPWAEAHPIYFSDCNESTGSVWEYRADTGSETRFYTRPGGRLTNFAFAPWDPDHLYYVNASDTKIFEASLDVPIPTETILFTHSTYVRDVAFDDSGQLFFSESSGAGGDGKIYRIGPSGTATLFLDVPLSEVDGFWAGEFAFAADGTLYLGTGNRPPGSIYEVDPLAGIFTEVYDAPAESVMGFTFGDDGAIYYGNNRSRIYNLDLATGTPTTLYERSVRDPRLCDVELRELPPPPAVGVGGLWVMPFSVRHMRLDRIKSTGLVDYNDPQSGLSMVDAPFGGRLWLRLDSSNGVPTSDVYYYRFSYKPEGVPGAVWKAIDKPISVHYTKNRPGLLPIFPTLPLGPNSVGTTDNLYRFRPHESELNSGALIPLAFGESAEWPKIGFGGDAYRARLETVELGLDPGLYGIRVEVFDSTGTRTPPGTIFQMIVPTVIGGVLSSAPAPIVDDGMEFAVHIDNRTTNGEILAPSIGATVTDDCGFLRYAPASPGDVEIGWHAWHEGAFAVYKLNIIRGAGGIGTLPRVPTVTDPSTSVPLPIIDEVGSTAHQAAGAAPGDFVEHSPTDLLLAGCEEAAFAIRLHVYAKATTGNGHRIFAYDTDRTRAFAIAPLRE